MWTTRQKGPHCTGHPTHTAKHAARSNSNSDSHPGAGSRPVPPIHGPHAGRLTDDDRTKKNLLSLADKAEQGDYMGIVNVSMDQAQFCYPDTFSGDVENLTSDLDDQFAELDEQLEELDKMLEDLDSGS